jgi:hypothetical protein
MRNHPCFGARYAMSSAYDRHSLRLVNTVLMTLSGIIRHVRGSMAEISWYILFTTD